MGMMAGATHLLDTSIYSQPLRRPESRSLPALERWRILGDAGLAICVLSDAEIRVGLLRRGSSRMDRCYEESLKGRLPAYAVDATVAETFADIKARQLAIGQPVGDIDLIIAACARTHGLIVATLNHRDFSRIEGLAWEDWGRG